MFSFTFTHLALSVWMSAGLPNDARLASVQTRLTAAMAVVEKERLPAEFVLNKVREGLAKRIPATGIAATVERLVQELRQARALALLPGLTQPSARLLQSIAEARLAGVDAALLRRLLTGKSDEATKAQAIESLADLKLRGYPPESTVALVESVVAQDAKALPQLPVAVETLRQDFALTTVEATTSLESGLKNERSLQKAAARMRESHSQRGNGVNGNANLGDDGGKGRGVEGHPGKGKALGRGKP